jgi:hypothetical protein
MDTDIFFIGGKAGRGVKLTTHLDLVPRLRMDGVISPLPHTALWHSAQLSTIDKTTKSYAIGIILPSEDKGVIVLIPSTRKYGIDNKSYCLIEQKCLGKYVQFDVFLILGLKMSENGNRSVGFPIW